jgi:hypothetical protein
MKPFTKLAAILIGLAALIHLYRFFYFFNVSIGSYEIPRIPSIIFAIVAAMISAGLWKESKR